MPKAKAAPAVDFSEGDSLMVNLNDVEDVSFEAMPKGMYPVTISDCEFVYSQASGNPMWTLTLEVRDGEYAGRKLYCHLVFAGKGLPITKRHLSKIAPELLESPFNPEDDAIINSMIGKDIRAKVTVRKYDGEMRNNVQGLFPDEGDSGFL